MEKILLVVDLQKCFASDVDKLGEITNFVWKNCKRYHSIIATQCLNTVDSGFFRSNAWTKLNKIEDLPFNYDQQIIKLSYGLVDYSGFSKEYQYDIIGFDTEGCVLKIALDMLDLGFNIRVLSSYCWSSGGKKWHDAGVALLKRLIGDWLDE